MEQIQNFAFYSFLLGAVCFGGVWLAKKDKEIAWIATIVVALLVVAFVFPSPEGGVNYFMWIVMKAIYLVAWGIAAWIMSKILPEY